MIPRHQARRVEQPGNPPSQEEEAVRGVGIPRNVEQPNDIFNERREDLREFLDMRRDFRNFQAEDLTGIDPSGRTSSKPTATSQATKPGNGSCTTIGRTNCWNGPYPTNSGRSRSRKLDDPTKPGKPAAASTLFLRNIAIIRVSIILKIDATGHTMAPHNVENLKIRSAIIAKHRLAQISARTTLTFFLQELDLYIQTLPMEQRLILAIRSFSGNASYWAIEIGATESNYAAFQAAFIRNFMGLEADNKIRIELTSTRYVRTGSSTMAQHFLKMKAKSRRLDYSACPIEK
jgi:hypothetical protein